MLSLSFVSFPAQKKSFDELYATLASYTAEKRIIYKRRFDTHFVATGLFTGRKFYTWMAKTAAAPRASHCPGRKPGTRWAARCPCFSQTRSGQSALAL